MRIKPNNGTVIEAEAIRNPTELVDVVIDDGVTEIGDGAFSGCANLARVTIPNGMIKIGQEAFSFCTRLTSVVIPDGVTEIGYGAFKYCTGLTSVTIPNSVLSIGTCAFYGCSCLKDLFIPPDYVAPSFMAYGSTEPGERTMYYRTFIGEDAFKGCSRVKDYEFLDGAVGEYGSLQWGACIFICGTVIVRKKNENRP